MGQSILDIQYVCDVPEWKFVFKLGYATNLYMKIRLKHIVNFTADECFKDY